MADYRHYFHIVCTSEDDTLSFGLRMGKSAYKDLVVCLIGGLGAGKTVFARGFARGMGITETITSPTFPIIQEYYADLVLWHMDLYRLSSEDEVQETGATELFDAGGVCLIEWPDRAGSLLDNETLWIRIEIQQDGSRHFEIGTNSDSVWNKIQHVDLKTGKA